MFKQRYKELLTKKQYYIKSFIYALLVSFLFFIPFIIIDKGYFLYYGDFNVQQIPFYQMVHDSIREGNFFWSFNTDLGANLIGSYTFYLLTSPFFWITLPFKSEAVPYLMGPLLIIKFAFMSLSAYVYIKRYVINQNYAVLGAMIYSLCGFSIYNIFFNHFFEPMIVFPLLLWGLDCYMFDHKKGVFAFTVFFSCFINYYFFVGQVVFTLIYFIIRILIKNYTITFKRFTFLFLEAMLGVGMSSIALIPTILCVLQNPRLENILSGWSALLYSNEQRYVHIIESLFFPPDIPARPNFTPDSNAKWSSVSAWIPLFSVTGVIAFFKIKQKHWIKCLLIVSIIMAFVPILNSSFQFFNSSYYARWFYMPILIMCLSTVIALQSYSADFYRSIKITAIITLCISLSIGLMPKFSNDSENRSITFGLMKYPSRFWIYVLISIFCIVCLGTILILYKRGGNKFCRVAILSVSVISVISSIYIIGIGKSHSYSPKDYIVPYCLNKKDEIKIEDKENCRCDVYNAMDNQAMFWQIPTIQSFHSIVPGSIMEFYPTVGVKRDVASRPDVSYYGLRSLLSCRWLFAYNDGNKSFKNDNGITLMPGYRYYDTQNGFEIWENQYYIPYGFSYDYYITRSQYESIAEGNRHLALLKAIVLDDDKVNKYKDILEPIANTNTLNFSQGEYYMDCVKRKEVSCYEFKIDNHGFEAKIDVEPGKDRIVFFSIPYENGFSAEINGEKCEIEKVNIGFMAVRVKAGESSIIRFNYKTPGLIGGAFISLISAVLFLIYLVVRINCKSKNSGDRRFYRPASIYDDEILMSYRI